MSGGAFQGDTTLATTLADRLDAHLSAGRLAPGSFGWTGEKGSLVGCLLESADAARWESELGLPSWLAMVADRLAETTGSPVAAAGFGRSLLLAIRPGADLVPLGSRVILRLLDDLKSRLPMPQAAAAVALAEVERLHRSAADGQPPAPPAWRAARRSATAATDAVTDDLARTLSACVETAAWNPASSSAVVYDTLRTWVVARNAFCAAEAGWRSDYEPTLRTHMQEMYDTYLKDHPELQATVTVFDLLAQHYPDDDRLVRDKNRIDREADKASYAWAAAMLLEMLNAGRQT